MKTNKTQSNPWPFPLFSDYETDLSNHVSPRKVTVKMDDMEMPTISNVTTKIKAVLDSLAVNMQLADEEDNEPKILYLFMRDSPTAGGYTIAYRPVLNIGTGRPGKMYQVAVAYCARGDMFSKKIGRYAALTNFYNGNYILLPAGIGGVERVHDFLKQTFTLV